MNPKKLPEYEKLSSGKTIIRRYDDNDGSLVEETHGYGILEIAIKYTFSKGVKTDELYFAKRRMVSRRTYEKARIDYADMPPADGTIEDWGSLLLRGARKQQLQNKAEAERRLAESAESRFPRPASTNWLRVISGEKSHLESSVQRIKYSNGKTLAAVVWFSWHTRLWGYCQRFGSWIRSRRRQINHVKRFKIATLGSHRVREQPNRTIAVARFNSPTQKTEKTHSRMAERSSATH